MATPLTDASCADFAAKLASQSPIPGGGGAAAYVGALSVALCSMVGNFTAGKPAYAGVEQDVQRMLHDAEAIRKRLLELVEEDAAAFEPLSKAYGMSKENPYRAQVLEEATRSACIPPMLIMGQVSKAIELLEEMAEKGSTMLLSDVGCGAALARAALEAASMNVLVNTSSLQDREYARELEEECEASLSEYGARAQKLIGAVRKRIEG